MLHIFCKSNWTVESTFVNLPSSFARWIPSIKKNKINKKSGDYPRPRPLSSISKASFPLNIQYSHLAPPNLKSLGDIISL